MIIIGDDILSSNKFIRIDSNKQIKDTLPKETVFFNYDKKLMKYCFDNSIEYAVIVTNIKEAIFSNALFAKYIITEKDNSKAIQKIAENYMFDSKVLRIIDNEDEISDSASDSIDGVIFRKVLL